MQAHLNLSCLHIHSAPILHLVDQMSVQYMYLSVPNQNNCYMLTPQAQTEKTQGLNQPKLTNILALQTYLILLLCPLVPLSNMLDNIIRLTLNWLMHLKLFISSKTSDRSFLNLLKTDQQLSHLVTDETL